MSRPDTRIAGFTTLGVPLFFCLLYLTAGLVGLPIAILASPAIFRLALVMVPPPSRLTLPTCPHLIRRDAIRAALRPATELKAVERPEAQRVTRSPVASLPARRPAHAVAASTDARAAA